MSGRSHAVDKQGQIAPGVIASDATHHSQGHDDDRGDVIDGQFGTDHARIASAAEDPFDCREILAFGTRSKTADAATNEPDTPHTRPTKPTRHQTYPASQAVVDVDPTGASGNHLCTIISGTRDTTITASIRNRSELTPTVFAIASWLMQSLRRQSKARSKDRESRRHPPQWVDAAKRSAAARVQSVPRRRLAQCRNDEVAVIQSRSSRGVFHRAHDRSTV